MACENCNITSPEEVREIIRTKTDGIIERIGKSREHIIPLLQALQGEFSYLPADALNRVYETTEIDRAQAISVATFYSQFRMIPYGRHTIRVCCGTACHVKGADIVYDAFRRELNIKEDTVTTDDQQYSIEKIPCLGCCALAPVVQIDNKIFGHVQPGRVNEVIAEFEQLSAQSDKSKRLGEQLTYQGEVRLGMENCCQASGTAEVRDAVEQACRELGIHVDIKPISCVGACNLIPLIDVATPDGHITRYPKIKPEEVKEVLLRHFRPSSRLRRLRNALLNQVDSFHTDQTWDNIVYLSDVQRNQNINTFLEYQHRISTEGYGLMNPLDIEEYISRGGFTGLRKALSMEPRQLIDEVLKSGLRGRGGGGFPTGRKWQIVYDEKEEEKYVICNGDEGDPGAFMDRILLESYPLRVIEGLIIAAYAVGARKAILYIRAEYPQAVIRVRRALEMCRQQGYIGENLFDTDFSVDVNIFEGAGAFVCGEETALIASIEGKRGFPRLRPPYPAQRGLFGYPTLINNVET
ncbi:MAG: NAD(P)H-dependent oxidoreductase subunit E, partial [Prevotella sp.]|nr:NAD(P)H-dependent oxidoreductase subunit E [Prevotella sp.]